MFVIAAFSVGGLLILLLGAFFAVLHKQLVEWFAITPRGSTGSKDRGLEIGFFYLGIIMVVVGAISLVAGAPGD